MYLSMLLIDVGNDPDRPRPGRLWLRNLYRVHQRLCMAFPSKETAKKQNDPQFLKPYDPTDFPEDRYLADKKPDEITREVLRQVHTKRDDKSGFLFRIEPQPNGRAVILVLSALEPDWKYAFGLKDAVDATGKPVGNAGYLLAAIPENPRPLHLAIESGKQFRFRLVANPTKRPPMTKEQRLAKKAAGEHIKRPRLQLTWKTEENPTDIFKGWLHDWTSNESNAAGFKVFDLAVPHISYVYIHKDGKDAKGQRLRSVRYEGILEITEADAFRKTLASGIGPAKAFGFGLLSLAPVVSG